MFLTESSNQFQNTVDTPDLGLDLLAEAASSMIIAEQAATITAMQEEFYIYKNLSEAEDGAEEKKGAFKQWIDKIVAAFKAAWSKVKMYFSRLGAKIRSKLKLDNKFFISAVRSLKDYKGGDVKVKVHEKVADVSALKTIQSKQIALIKDVAKRSGNPFENTISLVKGINLYLPDATVEGILGKNADVTLKDPKPFLDMFKALIQGVNVIENADEAISDMGKAFAKVEDRVKKAVNDSAKAEQEEGKKNLSLLNQENAAVINAVRVITSAFITAQSQTKAVLKAMVSANGKNKDESADPEEEMDLDESEEEMEDEEELDESFFDLRRSNSAW